MVAEATACTRTVKAPIGEQYTGKIRTRIDTFAIASIACVAGDLGLTDAHDLPCSQQTNRVGSSKDRLVVKG